MIEDNLDRENCNLHNDIVECQCEGCIKKKDRYVRIIDVDRFVDNLNDWDKLFSFRIGSKYDSYRQ